MPQTATTDADALLAAAANADRTRRITAVHEFTDYSALPDGRVINRKTNAVYKIGDGCTCTCPDFTGRIKPLRDRADAAGIAVTIRCKHFYAGRLLFGRPVSVGNSVFRAKKK